ncbi:MAG: putative zinc-binding protein [Candidatus Jordarchaeum sp.]|uniref:putative zinc-binding protein n=1 Tax=Candidatus Jordarchaeum sp. TaxID=2823881 RepID=UPI00404A14DE
MPIKQKIGIIACSGEKLVEGTLSRAAARIVVEKLRPENTIILCQPLFMAGGLERFGGNEERKFAKTHPTITIEGCEEECAKIAVESYSGPVAATVRVKEIIKKYPDLIPNSREDLGDAGYKLAEKIAEETIKIVDELYKNL